jgi:hypothetical protein
MDIKGRLGSAKRWLWSPMTVWMADQGCDKLVRAGERATVFVDVRGEDDGTMQHIEVYLRMLGWGAEGKARWPLAELPPTVGRHELTVTIPTGLAPACAKYVEYSFEAELHRTKGTNSTAGSIVDVVARPEDLYWPDSPRSGQEGDDAARISIELDAEGDVVAVGGTLTGRVVVFATVQQRPQDVELAFGPVVDTLVPVAGKSQAQPRARFEPTVKTTLAERCAPASGERVELSFSLVVADGAPPTLHNGGQTSVVWQLRVTYGKTTAWRVVGVHDPEALAGRRDAPSPSLLSFLGSLDTGR